MLWWFASVLLIFAIGEGIVLVVAILIGKGCRETRTILFDIFLCSLIAGLGVLSLIRLVPSLGL
jgi:hypothetical protein